MFNRTNEMVDLHAFMYGIVRKPGETDNALATRVRALLEFRVPRENNQYLKLCYVLAKLGVMTAKRDLPVGII